MSKTRLALCAAFGVCLIHSPAAHSAAAADAPADVNKLLKAARPGDVVRLPAGVFHAPVTLPPGVSLRGAGWNQTTLDAGGAPAAVLVHGGSGSRIEDLSIRTTGNAAVSAVGATDVIVRRVVVHGGVTGVRFEHVTGGRIENTIIDGSMTAVSLSDARDTAVTNCTLLDDSALAVSVVDGRHVAVFNNLIADAGTGVVLGGTNDGLTIDHNEYLAFYVGKVAGQQARLSLGPWRDVSGGLDAHSVQLPVTFADPARGDYRPTSRLDWSPGRSTMAGWGVPELAGFAAPPKDIDGADRGASWDLGAYAVPPAAAAPRDGSFTVASDDGTKSAGLFTPDGRLVRYLFHDLPLKKGEYAYVLPSRTQLGEPVPAGELQLRLVESNLRWAYRGITANGGLAGSDRTTDDHHTQFVAFAPDGSLLLGNGWSERAENVRSLDYNTRKPHWSFPGQAMMNGLCAGPGHGSGSGPGTGTDSDPHSGPGSGTAARVYCLRAEGQGTFTLSQLDAATGIPAAWGDGKPSVTVSIKDGSADGIAELDGRLYIADPAGNRLLWAPLDKPAFEQSIAVPSPTSPAADAKHKLIWVVSGHSTGHGKLIALETDGKTRAEFTGVDKPLGVAVRGDRLAVASAATGKVHLFDCSDPQNLKPLYTIGRGDGPFGPVLPDRFYFQGHALNPTPGSVVLALDDRGDLAVRDNYSRSVVFDPAGKPLYCSFAQFGNYPHVAYFPDDEKAGNGTRFFESAGDVSWFVDAKAGAWRPDARWGYPPAKQRSAIGFFGDGGRQFGVLDFHDTEGGSGVLIVRFENYVAKPVGYYTREKVAWPAGSDKQRELWVVRRDTNHDGRIDSQDAPGTPILTPDGKPIEWNLTARFNSILPDGSIVSPGGISQPPALGIVWRRHGLDADGAPVYTFGPESLIAVPTRTVPSAYDFDKTEDLASQSETTFAPDGDYLATFQFGHSPNGTGLSNSGAVDLARFAPDGRMKWLLPLNDFGPVQGVKSAEKFTLTSWGHQAEWIGLSDDGLSLGHLGFPPGAGWNGYWVDHPQHYRLFRGNDGRLHALVGDYMQNAQHWLSLEHYDDYRIASFPATVSPARARELAFEPPVPYQTRAKPPQPKVVVHKLGQPLPIDGKLEKWRSIPPQVVITPVTGHGIDSPRDASAVIRLAYENQNLYVQVLRFDDVVSFHQPSTKSHLQDTVEMSLNGFFDGFQFSISDFTDTGPGIVRRRFFFGKLEDRTPADHAPRVIRVLPDAKDVPERKLIESIYGEDLSNCKVIVTEFKLPIDKETYKGDEAAVFPMKSGSGVWIGFAIDDNDTPGSDLQKMLVWPATYGTFNVKEAGAWAVFE